MEALISESGNGTGIETVPDSAYALSQRAILSVNTGQIFPEGFPTDFSIISTFKPVPDSQSVLFSVYNDAGDEQLALEIDDRIILVYQVFTLIFCHGCAISPHVLRRCIVIFLLKYFFVDILCRIVKVTRGFVLLLMKQSTTESELS